MRFLVDAQLPPALAELLRRSGHEAVHVFEVLSPNARDHVIWPFALTHGYILVTKDEDVAEWSRLREPAPAVVWLRIGNVKRVALQARLEPMIPAMVRRLAEGEKLIEIR